MTSLLFDIESTGLLRCGSSIHCIVARDIADPDTPIVWDHKPERTVIQGVKQIENAVSHTVLLGQCQNFLRNNNIKSIAGPDTAGSAKKVASEGDKTVAALASELAGKIKSTYF